MFSKIDLMCLRDCHIDGKDKTGQSPTRSSSTINGPNVRQPSNELWSKITLSLCHSLDQKTHEILFYKLTCALKAE